VSSENPDHFSLQFQAFARIQSGIKHFVDRQAVHCQTVLRDPFQFLYRSSSFSLLLQDPLEESESGEEVRYKRELCVCHGYLDTLLDHLCIDLT